MRYYFIILTRSYYQSSTVCATVEEKAAWTSEVAQCMESAALSALLRACGACGAASASLPTCRTDRALFTDDVDIRFSRTLNSCKVPQIRSATPARLLQRLTGGLVILNKKACVMFYQTNSVSR